MLRITWRPPTARVIREKWLAMAGDWNAPVMITSGVRIRITPP